MVGKKPYTVIRLHTVLICEKWEECVSFYRNVLAFPVVEERTRFIEFQVVPGARIGLLRPLRPRSPDPGHDRVIVSVCVSNLEEAHSELRARCPDLPPIRHHPWGTKVFELKDPEGRRIEFWSPEDGL